MVAGIFAAPVEPILGSFVTNVSQISPFLGQDVNSALNEPRGKGVPKVVEAQARDAGFFARRGVAPVETEVGLAGSLIGQDIR